MSWPGNARSGLRPENSGLRPELRNGTVSRRRQNPVTAGSLERGAVRQSDAIHLIDTLRKRGRRGGRHKPALFFIPRKHVVGAVLKILDARERVGHRIEDQLVGGKTAIAAKQHERAQGIIAQGVEEQLLTRMRRELFEPVRLLIPGRLLQQLRLLGLCIGQKGFEHLRRLGGVAALALHRFGWHTFKIHRHKGYMQGQGVEARLERVCEGPVF